LSDISLLTQNSYLHDVFAGKQAIKDGILLLKVWLHQRQLDQGFGCLNGFILSVFVAYLMGQKKLNSSMTNYQVFRKTLVEFSHQDWCHSGISLAAVADVGTAEVANRPSLDDFHAAFDVVFVDVTGYVNLCADMSAANYKLIKQEAASAVHFMETSAAFTSLFMTPINFFLKYDQTFSLSPLETFQSAVALLKLHHTVADYCGDYVNACVPHVIQLLQKAFDKRVNLIALKATPHLRGMSQQWRHLLGSLWTGFGLAFCWILSR
jgi:U3 small nucleolar RNA-associated protein 22